MTRGSRPRSIEVTGSHCHKTALLKTDQQGVFVGALRHAVALLTLHRKPNRPENRDNGRDGGIMTLQNAAGGLFCQVEPTRLCVP